MPPGIQACRRAAGSIVALALIGALLPAATSAAARRPGAGELSPRLTKLAKPSLRAASPRKQAKALSLAPEGAGSLLREGNRVLVEVRFDRGATAGVDDLRAAGAKIVDVSPRYQTVTVAAKPARLRALSAVPRVGGATEVLAPLSAEPTCPSGAIVSEGDGQLHANTARLSGNPAEGEFGVDGSGVKVGILSDSFETAEGTATTAAEDAASGDLPGNSCSPNPAVEVLDDYSPTDPEEPEAADEGRAMAQIVHDLAPGASLAFASAFKGLFSFASNVEGLRDAGANVIADDVTYPVEPFFQEGPVGVAIENVTETGVTYLSAAGNNNLFAGGNEIGSWEAQQYRDSGDCPPAVRALPEVHGTHCLDFNPGSLVDRTLGIKVAGGATLSLDLQWDEPWFGVDTDLDAFLLNSTGGLIAASLEDNVEISQKPVEFVQWVNETSSQQTVQLVVNRFAGSGQRLKLAFLENGFGVTGIEYPRSTGTDVVGPTIFGHNGAADAISVGAVPYDNSAEAEPFSSRGPVTHYFGPTDSIEPAEELLEAEILAKPDVAATDCGVTSFFSFQEGLNGPWRFCGTSAAAPHAAAVAALMLDAEPATPAAVRSALLASGAPVGGYGGCAVGTGLIDARKAIQGLLDSVSGVEPTCAPPTAQGSAEESQAPGNWGIEAPPQPPPQQQPQQPQTSPPPSEPPVGPSPDRGPPGTFFKSRPTRVIRTALGQATAVFVFASNESGVTFRCSVDRGQLRACPARFVRRYRVGWHVLRVMARDAAGNTDATPAVFHFCVKQIG